MVYKNYLTMTYFKRMFFALLLFVASSGFAQNTFVVDAPRVVGQDEIFRIIYTANAEIEAFTKPTVTGADILAGPTPSRMQSYENINGKASSKIEISYTFILKPTSKSSIKVSAASATINGKLYAVREFSIDVVNDDSSSGSNASSQGAAVSGSSSSSRQSSANGEVSSDDVFLKLSFSKTKVVKGEPIVATLKLYTKVPIAGFEDIKFPVFNGFWSQEIETPQNINFVRENVGNQIYNSAILRKYLLLPQQTGELTVNPSEMICQVQIRLSQGGGRSIFDDFFDSGYQIVKKRVSSKATKINVSPLPGGAAASFGGGVGNFNMQVKLSRDSIKAHEAASVIVEVNGSGNINLIEAPKVELPADFEIYDVKTNNNFTNSANGISGRKTFETPFIPRSEGRFVVPPVEYSYFDIKTNKYVTLKSDSLVIKVAKGSANASSGALVQGLTKQAVANLGEDIRYIETSAAALRLKGSFFVGSALFFILLFAVSLAYVLLDFALNKRAKLRGDVVRTRNKKANKVARLRLKKAQSYLKEGLHSPFYEELHKALLGYISDKLAIQFADLQRDTINEELVAKGVSQEDITAFMQLLDDCEMARYSQNQAQGQMEVQYNKAMEIISNLENRL